MTVCKHRAPIKRLFCVTLAHLFLEDLNIFRFFGQKSITNESDYFDSNLINLQNQKNTSISRRVLVRDRNILDLMWKPGIYPPFPLKIPPFQMSILQMLEQLNFIRFVFYSSLIFSIFYFICYSREIFKVSRSHSRISWFGLIRTGQFSTIRGYRCSLSVH